MDFRDTPGAPILEYEEASASERKDRAKAFLGLRDSIAGVSVAQFTPRHWEWLRAFGNPFVCGGYVTDAVIMEFLLLTQDGYSFDYDKEAEKRAQFLVAHDGLDFELARKDIEEYLDRSFLDSPQGRSTEAFYGIGASLCYQMARPPFGWNVEQTMGTAIALTYQIIKARDRDEGASLINRRTGKVKSDWLTGLVVVTGKTRAEFADRVSDMERAGWVLTGTPNPEANVIDGKLVFKHWSVAMAKRVKEAI